MKISEPGFQVIHMPEHQEVLRVIELAGRVCYQSDPKGDPESFIKRLLSLSHDSVIEHISATIKIVCDRAISHEIVRHRIASYCLAGDTKILRFNQGRDHLTIKELYDRQNDRQLIGRNKLMLLRSMDSDCTIVPNKMHQIFYSGMKEVYEIKTRLGYAIKCSKDHIFFNDMGEIKVKDMKMGSKVYVNGRLSKVKISDSELIRLYVDLGLSPDEIANQISAPYCSVTKKLKDLGVFVKKKNDKNKEKYTKNHTQESYTKMVKTVKSQYANGRTVWNKGMSEDDHPGVKRQVESLLKYQRKNPSGEKNSNWKGDDCAIDAKRSRFRKYKKEKCEMCGSITRLENHHKDINPENWKESNGQTLCVACHNLLHHGYNVKKAILDDIISIKYVGNEETYDIEMLDPYHNFVANGFIVHNSQASTRYNNFSKGKFGGEITCIKPMFWEEGSSQYMEWEEAMQHAEMAYMNLLSKGATPEQARSVLPNSLKTEIVVTMNMRAWRHFFELRCAKTAHPQIIQIALPLLDEFHSRVPVLFQDLFEIHRRDIQSLASDGMASC